MENSPREARKLILFVMEAARKDLKTIVTSKRRCEETFMKEISLSLNLWFQIASSIHICIHSTTIF